jgi:hypothetical protein
MHPAIIAILLGLRSAPSIYIDSTENVIPAQTKIYVHATVIDDGSGDKWRLFRYVPGLTNSFRPLATVAGPKKVDGSVELTASDFEWAPGPVGFGVDLLCKSTKQYDELGTRLYYVDQGNTPNDNGVTVGKVKQFNVSSLIMLSQGLSAQLNGVSAINGTALSGAIGQFQGATASSSWFGVQGTTQPLPAVTTINGTTNPGATTNTGSNPGVVSTAPGSTASTQTSNPQVNAPLVSAPTQPSSFSFSPSFGAGAGSMLQDQVDLTYQIFNIQMLLQGALSDQYIGTAVAGNEETQSKQRYRTVIGVPITLEPKGCYKGAAAEVEVTFGTNEADEGAPSLIAMMPMSNSYNVAKMSQSASQVQLAANISILSLGLGQGSSSQSVYLGRDTDTLALLRSVDSDALTKSHAVRFAWQFRPVLGEPNVRAGTRTLFASVGLPVSMVDAWSGWVHVKTMWRKYDQKTKVAGEIIKGSVHDQDVQELDFSKGSLAEGQSGASVYDATWQDAGDGKSVTIDVDGFNFLTGTVVRAGPSIFAVGSGLVMANRSMAFTMPANLLGIADPYIIGPYGTAVRIREKASLSYPVFPITINKATWKASADGTSGSVTISVSTGEPVDSSPCLVGPADAPDAHAPFPVKDNWPHVRLLASVAGQVFGLEGNPIIVKVTPPVNTSRPTRGAAFMQTSSVARQLGPALKQIADTQTNDVATILGYKPNNTAAMQRDYTLTFTVPLATLKSANLVKLINPLWGEGSVASSSLTSASTGSASTSSITFLSDFNGRATFMLQPDASISDLPIDTLVVRVGRRIFAKDVSPRPGQDRLAAANPTDKHISAYLFTVDDSELAGLQDFVVIGTRAQTSASSADSGSSAPKSDFVTQLIPVDASQIKSASSTGPSSTITVTETVHMYDERFITLTGADFTHASDVFFDDAKLEFVHMGKDLLVKTTRELTSKAATKTLTVKFTAPQLKLVEVPITILPGPSTP